LNDLHKYLKVVNEDQKSWTIDVGRLGWQQDFIPEVAFYRQAIQESEAGCVCVVQSSGSGGRGAADRSAWGEGAVRLGSKVILIERPLSIVPMKYSELESPSFPVKRTFPLILQQYRD
jgi:hypothetical protein